MREMALTNHYFRAHEDHVIPPLTDVRSGKVSRECSRRSTPMW
jgi:hypothetical protein